MSAASPGDRSQGSRERPPRANAARGGCLPNEQPSGWPCRAQTSGRCLSEQRLLRPPAGQVLILILLMEVLSRLPIYLRMYLQGPIQLLLKMLMAALSQFLLPLAPVQSSAAVQALPRQHALVSITELSLQQPPQALHHIHMRLTREPSRLQMFLQGHLPDLMLLLLKMQTDVQLL